MGPTGAVIGGRTWEERVRRVGNLDWVTAAMASWKIVTGMPFRAIREEMKRLGYPSLSVADLRWLYYNDEGTVRGLLYRQAELPWVLARDLAQAKIDRALKRDKLCRQLCSIERRLNADIDASPNGYARRMIEQDAEVPADCIFSQVASRLSTCFKLKELLAMHNQEMKLFDEIRALDIGEGDTNTRKVPKGIGSNHASSPPPLSAAPLAHQWHFITWENHLFEMVRQARELYKMGKSLTPAEKAIARELRDRFDRFTLNQVLCHYPSLGFLSEVKLKKMHVHVWLYDRYNQLDRQCATEYRTLCSMLGLKFPPAPPELSEDEG